MNLKEMLLVLLIEECDETSQRATKMLRFGKDEIQPGQELTNELRLIGEFHDLVACAMMVLGVEDHTKLLSKQLLDTKREKIKKYLEYSVQCGTLNLTENGKSETSDRGSEGPGADGKDSGRGTGTPIRMLIADQVSPRKVQGNGDGQRSPDQSE